MADPRQRPDGPRCPWYVSAHAVRRYCALCRHDLNPDREDHFAKAEADLFAICAHTWEHYRVSGKRPRVTRTGAYSYRTTQKHGKIHLVVSTTRRPEGPKDQLVDIGAAFAGQPLARKKDRPP